MKLALFRLACSTAATMSHLNDSNSNHATTCSECPLRLGNVDRLLTSCHGISDCRNACVLTFGMSVGLGVGWHRYACKSFVGTIASLRQSFNA